MTKVGIIDYDCGNLFNVYHAFETIGAEPYFCKTPQEVAAADRLLLPGVGAFGDASTTISQRGLDDAIRHVATAGRPIMGICLGMQLLVDESEELGHHVGLGLIPGRIAQLPEDVCARFERFKIPNVGWSRLTCPEAQNWQGTVLENTDEGDFAYFVHSYHLLDEHPEFILATQTFGDIQSPAVIVRDNVYGCQFHPERSAEVGLNILKAWMTL